MGARVWLGVMRLRAASAPPRAEAAPVHVLKIQCPLLTQHQALAWRRWMRAAVLMAVADPGHVAEAAPSADGAVPVVVARLGHPPRWHRRWGWWTAAVHAGSDRLGAQGLASAATVPEQAVAMTVSMVVPAADVRVPAADVQ